MQKIMLDTMQYDKLLDAPQVYDEMLKLQAEGKIELLTTHIQRDELSAITNVERRARLQAILTHARLIATDGCIVGLSRVGLAKPGSDKDRSIIEHIRGKAWKKKSKDALIAATADMAVDVFVTDDKRLAGRLKRHPNVRCDVIDFQEFERRLANLSH